MLSTDEDQMHALDTHQWKKIPNTHLNSHKNKYSFTGRFPFVFSEETFTGSQQKVRY